MISLTPRRYLLLQGRREGTYNGRPKGNPLSTGPDGIRGVLDVGALDVLARLGEDAGAYAEVGVGA